MASFEPSGDSRLALLCSETDAWVFRFHRRPRPRLQFPVLARLGRGLGIGPQPLQSGLPRGVVSVSARLGLAVRRGAAGHLWLLRGTRSAVEAQSLDAARDRDQ